MHLPAALTPHAPATTERPSSDVNCKCVFKKQSGLAALLLLTTTDITATTTTGTTATTATVTIATVTTGWGPRAGIIEFSHIRFLLKGASE